MRGEIGLNPIYADRSEYVPVEVAKKYMEDTNYYYLRFLNKHLVPLLVNFKEGNKACPFLATAFVLSAENMWFLVTAGHVAQDINFYLTNPDYYYVEAFLCDIGGPNAKNQIPIPFDLTPETFIIFGDEKTCDYAVIHLESYYINFLKTNGVEPLDEQVWLYQPK